MTIATELSALKQNLAAAKSAITEMGGVVSGAGAETLESEIRTIKTIPPFGVVYYKESADGPEKSVELQSLEEFNSLCNSSTSWSTTIGKEQVTVRNNAYPRITGVDVGYSVKSIGNNFLRNCTGFNRSLTIPNSVTSIGNYFLYSCIAFNQPLTIPDSVTSIGDNFLYSGLAFNQPLAIPNSVTSIGNYFLRLCSAFNQPLTVPSSVKSIGTGLLYSCTAFNQPLTIPNTATSIGGTFLYGCTSFNQPLAIPSSVTSIGDNFLYGCTAFNQNITIPSSVTSIGYYFLRGCNDMTSIINFMCPFSTLSSTSQTYALATTSSAAACYKTGIKVSGTYGSQWKNGLPDSTSSPYRKLILV